MQHAAPEPNKRDAQRVGPRTTLKEKMGLEWNGGQLFQHPDPAHPREFSGQPLTTPLLDGSCWLGEIKIAFDEGDHEDGN
jgi:hypothetical protein